MKKKATNIVLTDCAGAGDIVSVAGLASPSIGHTVATVELTGGRIGDRLMAETNLAINVLPGLLESYEVQGRRELQLGILIENMKHEGFELSVSPPKVICRDNWYQQLD